jgi:sRNA-binding carbon storage regulator CsrA
MRVVSRRIGKRIVVPHCELLVTVAEIDGETLRLGVTAPAEIGAYREEPWRRAGSEAAPHDQPSSPIDQRRRASLGVPPSGGDFERTGSMEVEDEVDRTDGAQQIGPERQRPC